MIKKVTNPVFIKWLFKEAISRHTPSPLSIVTDQVSDQVKSLIEAIGNSELSGSDLIKALGLSHRPTFRTNYLNPALDSGWIERTQPDSPRSPTQRYRLSQKGRYWLNNQVRG